jgi:hypothetical protein
MHQPVAGVYRIDPDGTLHLIAADAGKANGIVVSPDQQRLYVSNVGPLPTGPIAGGLRGLRNHNTIFAYALAPAMGRCPGGEPLSTTAPAAPALTGWQSTWKAICTLHKQRWSPMIDEASLLCPRADRNSRSYRRRIIQQT